MVHTCKVCGLELPSELRLENDKKVHAKKSRIDEYGNPEFNAIEFKVSNQAVMMRLRST